MLSLPTKAVIVAGLVALTTAGIIYYRRQNRPARMGGAISRGKALWLAYAIFLWFVVCPALALDRHVPEPLRIVLGSFGLSMWLRGGAELYLLYFGHAWRPPYGIGHDAFCLLVLIVETAWLRGSIVASLGTPLSRWTFALTGVIAVSLMLEIGYAWTFYRLVRGQTTGAEGIWFASKDDARFRNLVRVTAIANVPLCIFLACYFGVVFR